MAIKKANNGSFSFKGMLPGYRKTTVPRSYTAINLKSLFHTSYKATKPDNSKVDILSQTDYINNTALQSPKNYRLRIQVSESLSRKYTSDAIDCIRSKKHRSAFASIELGLKSNPWSSKLHLLRAELLEAEKRPFEAMEAYRIASHLKKWNNIPYHKRISIPDPLTKNHSVRWKFQANAVAETVYDDNLVIGLFRKITMAACILGFTTIFGHSSTSDARLLNKHSENIELFYPLYQFSGQKAELDVILKNNEAKNLSGHVSIVGTDTTINDNAFLSPKNYILKIVTAIDDHFLNGEEIIVAGNPTRDGNAKLLFRNFNFLEGQVYAYNLLGLLLDMADIKFDNNLNFSTQSNIILIQYINGNTKKSFIVINNSNTFNMDIVQEEIGNASVSPLKSSLTSSKGTSSDDYSFLFTDPTLNVESYSELFTVAPGNKHTINKILNWTDKGIKYSLNTNTNSKIRAIKSQDATILDEETTSSGTLPTQTIYNRFNNETGLEVLYEITGQFTDTARFTRTQFRNEEFLMDTLRNGHFYVTINGNGTTYVVKKNGQTVATANVGQQSLFKVQGDQTGADIEVTGAGLVSKTVPVTLNKGLFTQTITLDPAAYSHTINGTVSSSIAGKLIKDNTSIYIVKAVGDTAWVNTSSGAFTYNWSDNNSVTSVKIGSKNVPGHEVAEITKNIDDVESALLTFLGKSYSLAQQVHVQNQTNENVNNVKVSGGDADVYTNTSGVATFTKSNLSTDVNNLPLANYSTNIALTASNIQTFNTIINSIVGTNPEALRHVNQIYQHLINGSVSSSKAGKIIKNGTEIYIMKAVGDTAKVNVNSSAFSYSWSDLNKTLSVKIGSLNVPGHSDNEITRTIDDNENVTITFTGLTYGFTHPVLVQDQFAQNVASATITGGDAPVQTGADGKAIVARNNLSSDVNNLPFANYVTSISATKSGFTTLNTSLTSTLGVNLEQLLNMVKLPMAVHDFYITLKDIHGNLVTDLTQQFEFNGDGAIINVTPDANGVIHIQKTEYNNPSTKLKVSNTSTKYNDNFIVFRKENHNLADTNYCQIQKFDGVVNFAELNLTGIPSNLTEYVAMEKVKTPAPVVGTYGDSISITHPVVRDMMGGRLAGATTKFISRPGAEQIYVFQMTFNETTGLPIAQAQLDRAKAELDKILAIYTQNDGNKLVNTQFYLINSYSDPKFVESQARATHDNMAYTTFDNSTPLNGLNLTLTYSPNGKARIKNSDSRYNIGTTTGIIFEEIYQQFTNNKDPPGGGTGAWVTNVAGDVTDFAKTMSRMIYLFNQGTPTDIIFNK